MDRKYKKYDVDELGEKLEDLSYQKGRYHGYRVCIDILKNLQSHVISSNVLDSIVKTFEDLIDEKKYNEINEEIKLIKEELVYQKKEFLFPYEKPRERQVKDMEIGEIGYVIPWGVRVNNKGQIYLKKDINVAPEPRGTLKMPIKKVKDGVVIDVPTGWCDDILELHPNDDDVLPVVLKKSTGRVSW